MNERARPPRFARRFLDFVLPSDVREDAQGDLEELFHRQREEHGLTRARLWYCRQTLSFSLHFSAERIRERHRQTDMSTGMSWIDFKLAVRMLIRYPGLTLVGVLGMAVGITIAAGAFTIIQALMNPTVPLPEGDRVVSIATWDASTSNRETRVLHDFGSWRTELPSLEDIGAFRTVSRNLIAPGAQPDTVEIAEMTASGFRVARVTPLLGRALLPDDERVGAPDVIVIGHEVWQRRFAADAGILGRQIQLGEAVHTVVGVMPQGFAFPLNHAYWIPFRLDPTGYGPRTGPALNVFARLPPGSTIEGAQTELAALGQRIAAASPETHEHLRPRVLPYTYAFTDMDDPDNALVFRLIQSVLVMLLVVVCVNVAILVYARTAMRQAEIAVRTALGASRRRIVAQLFVEALVLAGVAAFVGIGLVSVGLRQLDAAILQVGLSLPFWMEFRLSAAGAIYVVLLTLLAAAIVGVIPALKATGRSVQTRLQGLSAGGGSRMQMGRLWTTLIVAQVAVTVAVLPATMYHAWNSLRFRTGDRGFATQEFLTSRLALDRPGPSAAGDTNQREFLARYRNRVAELEGSLEAEAPVTKVTFSLTNPGEELAAVLEVEGMPPPFEAVDYNIVEGSKQGHLVRFNRTAVDFFDAFDVPTLMGRGFHAGDATAGAAPVLVNRAFVGQVLGGESPLGRRVRYVGRSREAGEGNITLMRWHEIVGVVTDFPATARQNREADARIYHAASPGDLYPAMLAIRVRGTTPSAFTGRLREIGAVVDPNLQLRNISSFDDAVRREQGIMRLIGIVLVAVMSSVVVLSAGGIYALMSFTVERRRKEIGIRAALGADSTRLLGGIFSRALGQLGIGALLGMLGAIGIEQLLEGEMFQGHGAVILPLVAALMTIVGLLAAYGPARRGLRIQPIEALREE